MIEEVLRALRDEPGTSALLPSPAHTVLLRGGPDGSRLSVAFFAQSSRAPVMFAKLGHDDGARAQLRTEHEALHEVAQLPALSSSVPHPLALLELSGATVQAQAPLPGTPLSALVRRPRPWHRRDDRYLRVSLAWLTRFQQHTVTGLHGCLDPDSMGSRLALALPSRRHARFRNRMADNAQRLAPLALPVVRRHGDFWPGNLLWHGDGIAVVDWEHSAPGALPTDDLFFFLTTFAHTLPGRHGGVRSRVSAFEQAWLGDGPLARLCADTAHGFTAALGLGAPETDVLLAQFLLDMTERPRAGSAQEWGTMLTAYADSDAWLRPGRQAGRGRLPCAY